jgi:hypothetical protein
MPPYFLARAIPQPALLKRETSAERLTDHNRSYSVRRDIFVRVISNEMAGTASTAPPRTQESQLPCQTERTQ